MKEPIEKNSQPLLDLVHPVMAWIESQNVSPFAMLPLVPGIVSEKRNFGRALAEAKDIVEKEVL
jgi:hypothetical protein